MKKKLPRFTKSKGRFYWTPTTNGKTRWARLPNEYSEALDKYYEFESGNTGNTVNHAFDLYIKSPEFNELAPETRKNYARYIRLMRPVFGHLLLDDIDAVLLSGYIRKMGYIGNNMMSPLSMAFKVAILEGMTRHNPVRSGDLVKAKIPRRIKEVDLGEVMRIYETCNHRDLRLYIDLALATGVSFSDITRLDQSNIRDNGLVVDVQKRRSAGRVLMFVWTPELRAIADRLPFDFQVKGLSRETIRHRWSFTRDQQGITDLKLHDLRTFALQETRRRGGDAQAFAGHSSVGQTAQYLAGAPKLVTPLVYKEGDNAQKRIASRIEQLRAELASYEELLT